MTEIKVMVVCKGGKRQLLVLKVKELQASDMTEHEIAALLFVVEFAVNNNASQILGNNVRMHINRN